MIPDRTKHNSRWILRSQQSNRVLKPFYLKKLITCKRITQHDQKQFWKSLNPKHTNSKKKTNSSARHDLTNGRERLQFKLTLFTTWRREEVLDMFRQGDKILSLVMPFVGWIIHMHDIRLTFSGAMLPKVQNQRLRRHFNGERWLFCLCYYSISLQDSNLVLKGHFFH